jgi:hypothetical protein
VRLAGKASADNIRQNTASLKERITANILDASRAERIGKVAVIDGAGEGLDLGVGEAGKSRTIPPRSNSPLRSPPRLVFPPPIPSGVGQRIGDLCGKGEPSDS